MSTTDLLLRQINPNGFAAPLLTTKIDYVGGSNPIYIGYAPRGSATSAAVWTVSKLTYDGNGNPTDIKWAPEGAVYDDRASLTFA
jgi:hypothetical protein